MQQNNHSNKDTRKKVFFLYARRRENYAETLEKKTEQGDTRKTDSMVRHT